jgi:hypothetical protein
MQIAGAITGIGDHAITAAIRIKDAAFGAGCQQEQRADKDKL